MKASRARSRRHFLHASGLFLAASTLGSSAFAESERDFEELDAPEMSWPILQGPTDHHSSSIIVLHPLKYFSARVLDSKNRAMSIIVVETFKLPGLNLASTEFKVSGLKPGEEYRLFLINKEGKFIDERTFGALDVEKEKCRFAVVSCMSDSYKNEAHTMWQALAEQSCDFVLFVGDTCYADGASYDTESHYAKRYSETRQLLSWFWQRRLTPSFATWDDHDFGLNNADRTFKFAGFNQKLFRKFWGSTRHEKWRTAFGVGSVFEAFGQRFFLLDDRSFRDPLGIKNGRHLGSKQTEWLIQELKKSDRPTWLINGSQFFGGYLGKESFEGDHAGDFKDFLSKLSNVEAPVAFISGDVHYSEVMKIEPQLLGYETYEFTSSSMHSFNFPFGDQKAKNPRRIVSEWRHNFLVLETNVSSGWKIKARCVRDFSRPSFSGKFSINRE